VSRWRWIANASPLIILANAGQVSLLEALCVDLVIPAAVAQEIRAGPRQDAAQHWLIGRGHDAVHEIERLDPAIAAWDLGIGESEVLTWARHHPEYEAIIDDRAARNCAITFGIPVRGTLGVVLLAKREGLVPHVQPVFEQLLDIGLRIAPGVLEKALDLAGERQQ
jgi:predicted nucleic acid-binding protein